MAQDTGQGGSTNAGPAGMQTSTILIDAESLFRSGEMLKASDLASSPRKVTGVQAPGYECCVAWHCLKSETSFAPRRC